MATTGEPDLFFVSGGTLPSDSPSYVERLADGALYDALTAGRYCYVLSPRQMGKSSLSIHTMVLLEADNVRTAFIDLTSLGSKSISPDQWYTGLALELARELDLTPEVAAYMRAHAWVSPLQRFFGALTEVALPSSDERLVLFIDEIDATRSLPFDSDDFFAAIRECFNRRVREPRFKQITFCLLGVAVPNDLIRSATGTPFNVGERISLQDFTLAELRPFAAALGPMGDELVRRIHYWTAGHPFLTQSMCRAVFGCERPDESTVDRVAQSEFFDYRARDSNINLSDVANIALHYGDSEPEPLKIRADVLSAYQRILAGRQVDDDESNRIAVLLKLSGLVKSEGGVLRVRNRVYKRVFGKRWIAENMPGQELRRQAHFYRQGLLRATFVGAVLIGGLGISALFVWESRAAALAAKRDLDYQLYVSDMRSLPLYSEVGDAARMETILGRHRNSPFRGFEWGYWMRQLHDAKEEYTLGYRAPGKRENGTMSANGKQVCIVDSLLRTATIVERASAKALVTVDLHRNDQIQGTESGWILSRNDDGSEVFQDLRSHEVRFRIPAQTHGVVQMRSGDCSDYLLSVTYPAKEGDAGSVAALNANSGKPLWSAKVSNLWSVYGLSRDGRTFCYSIAEPTSAPSKDLRKLNVVVYDGFRRKEIDRFPIHQSDRQMALSPTSDWSLFRRGDAETKPNYFLRDSVLHRTLAWTPPEGNALTSVMGAPNNHVIALFGGGGCAYVNLSQGNQAQIHRNAFAAACGAEPAQFLASSTSVRVFGQTDPANPEILAHGRRVTRYTASQLNVFGGEPVARRLADSPVPSLQDVPQGRYSREYTYNGRWFERQVRAGQMELVGSDPSFIPRTFPFVPGIWACGTDANSVACWYPKTAELSLISMVTGRTKWVRSDRGHIDAMWVSPNNSRLILVRDLLSVEIYDVQTGTLLGNVSDNNAPPLALTFTAKGDQFFTCGGDGRAVLWDLGSLRRRAEFRGNALDTITSADLSPDGTRVVTSSSSGAWQLWDASTGEQLTEVHASSAPLNSAIFSWDGKRLITAGEDGLVRGWLTIDQDPTIEIPVDPARLSSIHS